MKLNIAGIEFDHHDYDERGDTLYLSVGLPHEPARATETPEGHIVEYDQDGTVIGLELLNVRWTLDHEGALTLTAASGAVRPAARSGCGPSLTASNVCQTNRDGQADRRPDRDAGDGRNSRMNMGLQRIWADCR